MNNYSNYNSQKPLPEVFKELQKIQIQQVKEREQSRNKLNFNFNFELKKKKNIRSNIHKTCDIPKCEMKNIISRKFSVISVIIGILFLILLSTPLQSNYIFATSQEEEPKAISEFEENEAPLEFMNIVSQNISEVEKKDIVTEQYIIECEIEYIEDNQIPKDEEILEFEGTDGIREVTYIRTYEGEQLLDEKIINDYFIEEPVKTIMRKGTSEFLAEQKVHIGDILYTTKEVFLKNEPDIDSEPICKIYQYIDLKLEEVLEDNWCKVFIDGYKGYVKGNCLTSEFNNPEIVEQCRIQRIMISVKYDMELNKPSGLTCDDFKNVLSNNAQDVNKIFENNAEFFFEVEQKYNVNGILLVAIGIHESAWGTSTIAANKKNLFGYGAYDSSPYSSAFTFESYAEGIELLAKILSKYYLNVQGTKIYDDEVAVASFYNGPTVSGINVRYASDPNWSQKVFAKMEKLYEKLR